MRTLALLVMLAVSAPGLGAVVSDDFNDNATGPLWNPIEDAATVSIAEVNGRVEGQTTAGADVSHDAIYLSDGPAGFAVSTSSDFQVKVDYAFTDPAGAAATTGIAGLQLGVGTDASGDNSAGIALGIISTGFGVITSVGTSYRVNDAPSAITPVAGGLTGTFYISYDATADELHLSTAGYGAVGQAYANLVRGTWGADELLVGFGVRGGGVVLGAGDAWFDNFELTSGAIPEPASAAVVVLGVMGLMRRRVRREER